MARAADGRMRWMLRALLLLGISGVGAELLLIEHTADLNQLVPLLAMGVGIAALVADVFARRPVATIAMRLAMVGLIASGGLGLWLHYQSNNEFQRELKPELSGWPLFVATMQATSPPSLAPGAMAILGGIGLVSTCGAGAARQAKQGEE